MIFWLNNILRSISIAFLYLIAMKYTGQDLLRLGKEAKKLVDEAKIKKTKTPAVLENCKAKATSSPFHPHPGKSGGLTEMRNAIGEKLTMKGKRHDMMRSWYLGKPGSSSVSLTSSRS